MSEIIVGQTITKTYKCSIHGYIANGSAHCGLCDLCQHGVSLHGHCYECASNDFVTTPLTDAEVNSIEHTVRYATLGLFRIPSQPRNYTTMALLPKLMEEYRNLRANADKERAKP